MGCERHPSQSWLSGSGFQLGTENTGQCLVIYWVSYLGKMLCVKQTEARDTTKHPMMHRTGLSKGEHSSLKCQWCWDWEMKLWTEIFGQNNWMDGVASNRTRRLLMEWFGEVKPGILPLRFSKGWFQKLQCQKIKMKKFIWFKIFF